MRDSKRQWALQKILQLKEKLPRLNPAERAALKCANERPIHMACWNCDPANAHTRLERRLIRCYYCEKHFLEGNDVSRAIDNADRIIPVLAEIRYLRRFAPYTPGEGLCLKSSNRNGD